MFRHHHGRQNVASVTRNVYRTRGRGSEVQWVPSGGVRRASSANKGACYPRTEGLERGGGPQLPRPDSSCKATEKDLTGKDRERKDLSGDMMQSERRRLSSQ